MNASNESLARPRYVSFAVVFIVTWLLTWLLFAFVHDFSSYISYDSAQTWRTVKRASWSERLLYSFAASGVFSLIHATGVSLCQRFAPPLDRIAARILGLF